MQERRRKMESFLKEQKSMITELSQAINKNEPVQAAISYGLGCASVWLGWICEGEIFFKSLTMFLGCFLLAIRAMHDIHRYLRWARKGGDDK